MRTKPISIPVNLVLAGAGLIGRYAAPLLATLPNVRHVRVIDRDVFEESQFPEHAGRPKAVVMADMMRGRNPQLYVEPIIGDIEDLPLGLVQGDVLLTCLDSRRARIRANFVFTKLGIAYWIDAGISSPSLARISIFAQGKKAPCYECGLNSADYAADQVYPCQPAQAPPRTNSPDYLGAFAAALQVSELAKILNVFAPASRKHAAPLRGAPAGRERQHVVAGDRATNLAKNHDMPLLSRELVYDLACHKLAVTRLVRRPDCRCDHRTCSIQRLSRGARNISLQDAMELGASRRNGQPQLQVPGTLFVRRLVCPGCGEQRSVLHLKGRLSNTQQTCTRCGQLMGPLGISLTNTLAASDLAPSERSKPLSALGLCDADVLAVNCGARTEYFTFHHEPKARHG